MYLAIPKGSGLQRGLSGDLWTGQSQEVLNKVNPSLGWGDKDDFLPYYVPSYNLSQIDSGTGTVIARELAGGWIRMDPAGTTTAEGPQIQRATVVSTTASGAAYAPTAVRKHYFETLIRVSTLGGNGFFGLATVNDNALETDGTITSTGANNAIGFYIVNSEVRLVAKNGTSFTAKTSLATITTALTIKLGFLVDGVTSVTPYINGTAQTNNRITTAASICLDDLLVPTFGGTSITNRTLWDMDWWAVACVDGSDAVGV